MPKKLYEQMCFERAVLPEQGNLRPDFTRAGLGLELRRDVAERFAVR